MSFLKRIFGGKPAEPPPVERIELPKSRGYPMEVVGESFYQDNFERICGPRSKEGEDRVVDAVLVLDNKNKHDANAVRVEVNSLPVGHLAREMAPAYRAYLFSIGKPAAIGTCKARIKGGWQRGRGGSDVGNYGIYLSINLP